MTVRFIVLGMGRTGSNLLQSLLASHTAATCYGELFNNSDEAQRKIYWQTGRKTEDGEIELRNSEPIRFLEERVFDHGTEGLQAVGFKVFYYHARTGPWEDLWPWLKGQPELRILHLRRRDYLRRVLSAELAKRSDQWTARGGTQGYDDPIEIPVDECRKAFERMRNWEREGDEYFAGDDHHVVQLNYEDLTANTSAVMQQVQQELGLPHEELSSPMSKQQKKPITEVIRNYADLRDGFAGTEWQEFFEAE